MKPPIIRLEIEGMKQSIYMMLAEKLVQMDADVQAAVDAACTPEKIAAMIQTSAHQAIESAIKCEISDFYSYGPGRRAVAEAVQLALKERHRDEF